MKILSRWLGIAWMGCCFVLFAAEETEAPAGVIQARLVDGLTSQAGTLHVEIAQQQRYRCRFDAGTYFERVTRSVGAEALKSGDDLELVTDRRGGACYVRTARVLEAQTRQRTRTVRPVVESWLPRGNVTIYGVVVRMNPELMIVRTKGGEERMLVLRPDTRYVDSGVPSTAAELRPNTRVFLRAGQNLEQELEVYQVVWGSVGGP